MDYSKNFSLEPIKYFCEFDLIWKIEEWRDVVGYEGSYQVSDLGRVKSLPRFRKNGTGGYITKERILKTGNDGNGYLYIILQENCIKKPFKIHQLVAISFLNHKLNGLNKIVVDHKNNNRLHNHLNNLQIISSRQNRVKDMKKGSSIFIGVYWDEKLKKWRSRILINGKRKSLGCFKCEAEAGEAYKKALKNIKKP